MSIRPVNPVYYPQLTPAQFLNQAADRFAAPVSQNITIPQTYPCQPVYQNNQTYYSLQAFDKYTKGHSDLAIQNLEKSIEGKQLDNSDIDTMVILGRLYREAKQYDKSLNILQQAKNIDNSYVKPLLNPMPPDKINFELGKTYFAMGKIKEAKELMQGEKVLYDFQNPINRDAEKAKDYNELTHILNVQA